MFPESIEGAGLRLRILTPADVPALLAFVNRREVMEPTSSEGWTVETLDQFVRDNVVGAAEGTWGRYGILRPGMETPIGSIGLFNVHHGNQRAEIGYDLSPEYWGQGLMTRAAAALIGWAFANGFHRIEATVMEGNRRSERVLEKLAFEREAMLRDYKFVRGEFRNYSMWSLLASGG